MKKLNLIWQIPAFLLAGLIFKLFISESDLDKHITDVEEYERYWSFL